MSERDSICAPAEKPVEYREVPGFPGYRVGSDGSAWTCITISGRNSEIVSADWRPLSVFVARNRRRVSLRKAGVWTTMFVYRLVLEAFVGPRPPGYMACHYNGNSLDDRLENLRWGTSADNSEDAIRHGTTTRGEKNNRAKLTTADVLAIRREFELGKKRSEISKQYGVGWTAVDDIVRRKKWAHVPDVST